MARPTRSLAMPALLGLLLLLGACGDDTPPEAVPSLTVSLAAPRLADVTRDVVASGAVAAWEEVSVGVELSGLRVSSVEVEVGSVVAAGDVLLRIDDRTMASQLAQAEAAVVEARTTLETTRRRAARIRELANSQMVALQDAEQAEAERDNAEARLNTAIASRDAARVQRDFTVVRAPVAGVVSARSVQPGQVVGAGTELLRLIRDGRLEWRAELPERQLALVEVGNPVELAYQGSTISGRVRAVSPGVDAESRTGTLYVDLPEPGPLKAGVYLEGRIVTGSGQALMLPSEAVVQRDGHAYVFVLDDGQVVQRRRVRTGLAEAGRIEIVEGLEPGRQVVVKGAGFLGEGDRVRVVADTDTEAGAP